MRSIASLLASALLLVSLANSQTTEITIAIDFEEGLIYFLVILFFAINFGTPVFKWLFFNFISKWVDKTAKQIAKASACSVLRREHRSNPISKILGFSRRPH
jgi:hypothetical protein